MLSNSIKERDVEVLVEEEEEVEIEEIMSISDNMITKEREVHSEGALEDTQAREQLILMLSTRERFNSRNRAPYGSRRGGNSMDVDREAVLGDETSVWKHDMFEQAQTEEGQRSNNRPRRNEGRVASLETGTKVLVTNLDYGVSEDDLKELFEQCGEIKRVRIRYDKAGRSQGSGEVVFAKRSDASDAIRKYNTVELDGKPMNVSLAPAPVQRSRSENDGLFVSTEGSGRRIVGNNNGGRRSVIRGNGGRGGRRPSFRNRNNTMSDN